MSETRIEANEDLYCLRRLHPQSSYWKGPPDNRPTSLAYGDRNQETSVDLFESEPTAALIQAIGADFIAEGFGFSFAQVQDIKTAFRSKNVNGTVLHAPLPDNDIHGVITGKQNKPKLTSLKEIFQVILEPKSFEQMYPGPPPSLGD